LMEPFRDFFINVINAEGDIAIDRTHDREEEDRKDSEKVLHFQSRIIKR
jgi:hypothetical protein